MDDSVFNLEEVITEWQVENLPMVPSKKYGVPYPQLPLGNDRQDLVDALIVKIKNLGKPKEYFTNTTRDFIVDQLIPKSCDPHKLKGWRGGTKKTVNLAIERVYKSSESKPKIETSNNTPEVPKKPEQPVVAKRVIKKFDPSLFRNREDADPPATDEIDEEMAKLLGLDDKNGK